MTRRPKSPPDLRKAVAYLRVSTTADRQKNGFPIQRQRIEQWAEVNGVEIVEWYADEVSGTKTREQRLQLDLAIGALQAHRAGLLVVQSIDRFTRDATEGQKIKRDLQLMGVRLATSDGGIPPPPDDHDAALIEGIRMLLAEHEVRRTRSRILRAKDRARQQGQLLGGSPPYGYRRASEPGQGTGLLEEPDEQAVIAVMVEAHREGLSSEQIARRLDRQGHRNRAGGRWGRRQVTRLVERHAKPAERTEYVSR